MESKEHLHTREPGDYGLIVMKVGAVAIVARVETSAAISLVDFVPIRRSTKEPLDGRLVP